MKAPERPDNEETRLEQLYRLDILDTPPEAVFDDLTRLAAMFCGTLFSTVSLIDQERQWFKSTTGPLGVAETPRDLSFCGHTILRDELLVVEDAQADVRFRDNPLVTAGPMIRFYAGAPLITQDGLALGTLCVFDPQPRSLSDSQQEALRLLARQITQRIEQRLTDTLVQHLSSLLDVSNSYVVMFDPFSERISYVNAALRQRLSERFAQDTRTLFAELFPDVDYDRYFTPERLGQSNAERRKITRIQFPDLPDGRAELRLLSTLDQGRHTCVLLFNDQSELSRTQRLAEQAQSNLKVFSQVARQSKNAVIITDANERIEWVNQSFETLTGYTASEAMGRVPGDFLQGPDTADIDRERIRKHLDEGKPVVQEILNYGKNGQSYWVEIYIEPIRNNQGRITHFVASQANVTHRREQEQAIRAARNAAERANRAKSQFLANISHELRTPLNGIMGVTEQLQEQIPEPLADLVGTLDQSSRHLLDILNDLLDLSHIQNGHLALTNEPFRLDEILQDVERLFRPRADSVGTILALALNTDLPESTPLVGDATRLKQVLMNLVNNAVKFTQQGRVELRAQLTSDPDAPSLACLHLAVADTGPGIAPEHQARIFESFEQLDNSSTRVHGGSGLGLAISRQIVKAMGSDIELDSTPGQGSTFHFTLRLPLAPPDSLAAPLATTGGATGAGRPVSHALVIDDNEINRKILETLLKRLGFPVVYSAPSARRALALLDNLQPDLVFVDLHMPGMDGEAFLDRARQEFSERGRPLPWMIACTADVGEQQRRHCLRVGFDAHLAKPVSGTSVRALLADLGLAVVAGEAPVAAASPSAPAGAPDHTRVLDLDQLKKAFLGNEDLLGEFLGLLLENLPTHLIRIREALMLGNVVAHYDAAHSIKGLVGYFEDAGLMERVTALESAMKRGDVDAAQRHFDETDGILNSLMTEIRALLPQLVS